MNDIKKPRISTDLIIMAVFTVIGISMVWNTTKVIYRNYELQQQVSTLESEIELLELENQNLAYGIEYYQSDTFLELEAREKFNKAEPGEKLALLPRDLSFEAKAEPANEKPDPDEPQFKSNFSSWWEFLFGRVQ